MTSLPLRGWLLADAISLTGTRISMIAIPWFVLTTTGSAAQTGIVAAAEVAPLVLMKALGGPLIDRFGARRMGVTCDALSFLAVGAIPLLHHLELLTFPLLLVLVALAGALRGPGDGAKAALVPAIVSTAGASFERATGLHSAVERAATMLGAAGAGALVAWVGAANALYVDAVSFAVAGLVLLASTGSLPRVTPEERDPAPYVVQLRAGWDFLRHDPVLVGLAVMVATTNLLDLAWTAVLMPVWARESGAGVGAIGLLLAVWSAASTVSSLAAARWGHRIPRFATYVVAFLVTGLPRFAAMAFGAPVWLLAILFVGGGFASGFLNPILGAVVYERIPPHLTGRVTSLNTALCWSLMPFGGLLGGLLVTGVGLAPALLGVGVAYLVVTLAPLVFSSFREFDRRPESPTLTSVG